jgi:simple sugar transport system permease protein
VGRALFGQTWLLYLLYPLIPAAWWLVYRTRWGLEVRAVGENPQAADVSGIHVNRRRRQAICVAGLTCGLAGAFLTLGQAGRFGADGVSGRGFIAIAAVIFGGWTLKGTIGGALVFGLCDAFRFALPSLGYTVNAQLLGSLPYVMALLTMVALARRSRQPAALAQPFFRGLT